MDPVLDISATITITLFGIPIVRTFTMSTPVSGLTNAQNADTALTAEIATYLTDVAAKLSQALASGDSDTAVQAIADDLLKDAATLQAADPMNPVVPPVTPGS